MRKTPVPIPNTVVKTHIGENTWRATAWEDNSLPAPIFKEPIESFPIGSFLIFIIMKIFPCITKLFTLTALSGSIYCGAVNNRVSAQNLIKDTVEIKNKIPPEGTSAEVILSNSPNPHLCYLGEDRTAKFVVSLSNNVLYYYDNTGKPVKAYSVATGKPSTPTYPGVRMVSHVETYPYSSAPRSTKRRRNPKSYGSHIIILDKVDVNTGEKSMTGQFIHGNNDSTSIGKCVSKGCIRMSNKVIDFLSTVVKRGDLVIIKK